MENKIAILHDTIQGMSADAEDKGKKTFGITLNHDEAKAICHGLNSLERKTPCTLGDTEHRSPYEATVDGMLSTDYKERFKAEYQQTKIRYEKLKAFCNRIEAAMRTCPGDTKRVAMPEHDCPLELLRDQQRAMDEYLHCLEIRAVIEGIDL
jgi:hypothetical protein